MIAALLLGCASAPEPAAAPAAVGAAGAAGRPDLAVILAPGLRADASVQGGAEAAFFTALGRRATHRFSAAYSQSPAPYTSLGSVLTGLYPGAIPMCSLPRGAGHLEVLTDPPWCATLPTERYSFPEVLGLYGYHTTLLTSGFPAAAAFAGEFQAAVQVSTSEELAAAARSAVAGPGPHLVVVVPADLRMSTRADVDAVLGDLPRTKPATEAEQARALAGYATAAGTLGTAMKGVMDELEAAAGRRGLVTVAGGLTGLNLAEQGGSRDEFIPTLAEDLILDRTIHVPLAVFDTGSATAAVHEDPVELIDVFPTLAAVAEVRTPVGLSGSDLQHTPLARGAGYAYAELGDQLAVRQGAGFLLFRCYVHFCTSLDPQVTERLLDSDLGDFAGTSPYVLWDVASDPYQSTPSLDTASARALRSLMVKVRSGAGAVPADALDAKRLWSIRMVRSNGYW